MTNFMFTITNLCNTPPDTVRIEIRLLQLNQSGIIFPENLVSGPWSEFDETKG